MMNTNNESMIPMTMTVEQMAAALGISRNTAYALANEAGFPSFRVGKRLLVNREMLQVWMDRQCDCSIH